MGYFKTNSNDSEESMVIVFNYFKIKPIIRALILTKELKNSDQRTEKSY